MVDQTELELRLRATEIAKADTYDKRTRHLKEDGSAAFINRLVLEDSPYLLQHAHNPVNWYPWGEEAFAAARQLNRPLFLSIGYSTCHWCHVMEEESFDNVEVATRLNRHFISIKMDREQYPDIDDYYMTGVQLMSGHGGWPMSSFLLFDGRPFFGATYFPAPNFIHLLDNIVEAWETRHPDLVSSANSVDTAISRLLNPVQEQEIVAAGTRNEALKTLYRREDRTHGGLAGAPKFPQEPLLMLVLDQVIRERDERAAGFLVRALEGMGNGGIHDQVGGGFHRYSVDEEWLVPHFEKMLYNQSQLGMLYSEAGRVIPKAAFRRIATRLFDYVLRDMQLEQGGFYSATDADSEGREGTFFLWTPDQLQQVLGEREARFFIRVFRIADGGNFEGATILNLEKMLEAAGAEHGENTVSRIDDCLLRLYRAREKRIHPLRDDKLIVAWCAAMATALVRGADILQQSRYLEAARGAVTAILTHNRREDGRLWRISLHGRASITAQLEDYGNLIEALIALFDATSELPFLVQAAELAEVMISDFHDKRLAAFHLGPAQQTGPELVRSRSAADGATLSAVATVLSGLWELAARGALLDDPVLGRQYRRIVLDCLSTYAAGINANALGYPTLLRLLARTESGSRDPVQYAAEGRIRIVGHKQLAGDGLSARLSVEITCGRDWHIIAPNPAHSGFSGVDLQLDPEQGYWQPGEVRYPAPHASLALHATGSDRSVSIPIYRQLAVIEAELLAVTPDQRSVQCVCVRLQLQACNERECQQPETLTLVL